MEWWAWKIRVHDIIVTSNGATRGKLSGVYGSKMRKMNVLTDSISRKWTTMVIQWGHVTSS